MGLVRLFLFWSWKQNLPFHDFTTQVWQMRSWWWSCPLRVKLGPGKWEKPKLPDQGLIDDSNINMIKTTFGGIENCLSVWTVSQRGPCFKLDYVFEAESKVPSPLFRGMTSTVQIVGLNRLKLQWHSAFCSLLSVACFGNVEIDMICSTSAIFLTWISTYPSWHLSPLSSRVLFFCLA